MLQTYNDRIKYGHLRADGSKVEYSNDKAEMRIFCPDLDTIVAMFKEREVHLHGRFNTICADSIDGITVTTADFVDGTGHMGVVWSKNVADSLNDSELFELRGELKYVESLKLYRIVNPEFSLLTDGCPSFRPH